MRGRQLDPGLQVAQDLVVGLAEVHGSALLSLIALRCASNRLCRKVTKVSSHLSHIQVAA